jgi:hypothetical protein
MIDSGHNLLNLLSSVIGDYLSLKTDDFRKRIVAGLSLGFSRVLSVLVIVMLLMIVLAVLAFGLIVLIGDAIGSWSAAAFIVGGVCMTALIILIIFRKKLFLKMFTNIFNEVAETESSPDEWKSLPLAIVRYLRSRLDN